MTFLRGWQFLIIGALAVVSLSLINTQTAGDALLAQVLLASGMALGIGFLGALIDRVNHPDSERPSKLIGKPEYRISIIRRFGWTLIVAVTVWMVYLF